MGLAQSACTYVLDNTRNYRRKRRRHSGGWQLSYTEEDDSDSDSKVYASKRMRLMTTSQYIYKALFQEGKNHDVTLVIFEKEWNLHKIYLCQSPYFASMFSGSWKESDQSVIQIEILDSNINFDSLNTVLGSLYQDELIIQPSEVVSILATAALLQLDAIISKCCEVMTQTVNIKTVIRYYESSKSYGVSAVEKACLEWFLVNLLCYVPETPDRLREISIDLMELLVTSQNLCVVQTEFSLYVLLKFWLYLKFHPNWEGSAQDGISCAHNYFKEQGSESDLEFLLRDVGSPYLKAFRGLRLASLIGHPQDVDMILGDRIIPASLLLPVFRMQWYRMLQTDQGYDKGPCNLTEIEFNQHSLRCGRVLGASRHQMWRWTGFHFGLDLVLTYERGSLKLRRNHRTENEMALSQQTRRNLMFRLTIYGLDEQRMVRYTQSTGIQSTTLGKNEEICLITLEKEELPLFLSANFLVATPLTPGASETEDKLGLTV
ncbi:protein germ cell-less-like isoform X1 [Daphnia carinata]|uniref:protein germ cell-less-like isoform X1 n=2 Tax=Daphnia carinata TaxID=120202 RepID=UPI00257AEF8A|nr:protein germ cell-less-like isoform X1 [Daphnia carinata]